MKGTTCSNPVPNEGQNLCTAPRGHEGPHRCKAADVDDSDSPEARSYETHPVAERTITITEGERDQIVKLLHSAASINRDYLRRLPQDRRGNPTEDYVGRFTTAASRLEAK
jgi:hypothetical protein